MNGDDRDSDDDHRRMEQLCPGHCGDRHGRHRHPRHRDHLHPFYRRMSRCPVDCYLTRPLRLRVVGRYWDGNCVELRRGSDGDGRWRRDLSETGTVDGN